MTLKPLLAYLPWQARDLAVRGSAPLGILLALGGLPIAAFLYQQGVVDLANDPRQAEFVRAVYQGVAPLTITLGAFLFMTSSLAMDRDKQHVRFLFSHQVNPVSYYLQRFVLGMLVFLALFSLGPLALEFLLGGDVQVLGTLAGYAISLVLIGGMTVLASSLTNRDGVLLILLYILVRSLQQLTAQDLLPDWMTPLVRGMPPLGTMSELTTALVQGNAVQTTDVVHVLGYGLGMLIAGLLVVRRAPLVR